MLKFDAFATGITVPMLDASSSTVVLPKFCVVINKSDTLVASLACNPYALIAVVRTSTAFAPSVKPPFASFIASVVNWIASF